MATLYITQAQPNPPGKDVIRPGYATNEQLNGEWIEFMALGGKRSLIGDEVLQLTFDHACRVTGTSVVVKFTGWDLSEGQSLRLHTGSGSPFWSGNTLYAFAGRSWFIWNNGCGDRVTLRYSASVIDSAGYRPSPAEGILVRVPGTDRLEPQAFRRFG